MCRVAGTCHVAIACAALQTQRQCEDNVMIARLLQFPARDLLSCAAIRPNKNICFLCHQALYDLICAY